MKTTPSSPPVPRSRREWPRRPLLSLLLRCSAVALPALATLAVAVGLSRILPHPSGLGGVLPSATGMAALCRPSP